MFSLQNVTHYIPFLANRLPCGFPSPADDYIEGTIDLMGHIVQRQAATFVMQVEGDSMIGKGIFPNDYVLIDRSKKVVSGSIVAAVLDGEHTLKEYRQTPEGHFLVPANKRYRPIPLSEDNPPRYSVL